MSNGKSDFGVQLGEHARPGGAAAVGYYPRADPGRLRKAALLRGLPPLERVRERRRAGLVRLGLHTAVKVIVL
eukprot:9413404-Pyramimonas_sp.AAC.1